MTIRTGGQPQERKSLSHGCGGFVTVATAYRRLLIYSESPVDQCDRVQAEMRPELILLKPSCRVWIPRKLRLAEAPDSGGELDEHAQFIRRLGGARSFDRVRLSADEVILSGWAIPVGWC
jgi:hypothetical protein